MVVGTKEGREGGRLGVESRWEGGGDAVHLVL